MVNKLTGNVRHSRGTVRVEAKSRSQKQAEVSAWAGRENTVSSTKGLARQMWLNRNRLAMDRQTEQRHPRTSGKVLVKQTGLGQQVEKIHKRQHLGRKLLETDAIIW